MPAVMVIDGQIEAELFPTVVCDMIDFADIGGGRVDWEVHVVLHLAMCAACARRLAGFRGLN